MTARINQAGLVAAIQRPSSARVNQVGLTVAFNFAPKFAFARIDQAAIIFAARRYPIKAVAPLDSLTVMAGRGCCNSVPFFTREA